MERTSTGLVLLTVATLLAACRPELSAPRESVRITGVVVDVPQKPTATPTVAPTPTPPPADATPQATAKPKRTPRPPVVRALPVGVVVYERCSSQLLVFQKCPGRFLGEAKLAKPGPFVIEIDTLAPEISLFAFRGFLEQVDACAVVTIPVAEATKPLTLSLENGSCSAKLKRPY
jgi:hypothetical protein